MFTCNACEEDEGLRKFSDSPTNSDLENDYDDYIIDLDNVSPDSSSYYLSDDSSCSDISYISSEDKHFRTQSAPPALCPVEKQKEEEHE